MTRDKHLHLIAQGYGQRPDFKAWLCTLEIGVERRGKAMTRFKYEPTLYGWDDEKVCFVDETGVEWRASDHPDLVALLVEICQNRSAQRVTARSEGEERR